MLHGNGRLWLSQRTLYFLTILSNFCYVAGENLEQTACRMVEFVKDA